jgi:large repetitive protein
VPGASAGNFDEQRMGCAGEDPATCAEGEVGKPYELKIFLTGDEDEMCAVYTLADGSQPLPPGLSVRSDEKVVSGTPTEAGKYDFYLNVAYNREVSCQFKNPSQDRFIIEIKPGAPVLPKLTIGPEQSGVPIATTGTAFSLPMTANLQDAKTWTVEGTLPPGLNIDGSTGVISGTPTTAGTYSFTVRATLGDGRTDTKSLTITVRAPLAITASEDEVLSEVGVRFQLALVPSGGSLVYTWTLTSGELPEGLTFTNGTITGRPRLAGDYGFLITLTDSEGRTATYVGDLSVEPRLAIPRHRVRPGMVGKRFRLALRSLGGAGEATWRIKRGPLPKGIRFNRTLGEFAGRPEKAGTWRVQVELRDELGVKAVATIVIVVKKKPIAPLPN